MRKHSLASLVLVMLAALASSCRESAGTMPPQTLEAANREFDQAIIRMGWAQADLWRLGGRDIVVSVQIDSSLPPSYFRLPRRGVK